MRSGRVEEARSGQAFHLVQRLSRSPVADMPADDPRRDGPLAKLSNAFGYGTMGDYDLGYMGAAEFEWGAIPDAQKRLAKAKLTIAEWSYSGHDFDFLWIAKEGEPFDAWTNWAEGRWLDYTGKTYERTPFDGKERPYELVQRLNDEEPWDKERGWQTAIYWALGANVIWSFKEDGHLPRWLESMGAPASEPPQRASR